MICVTHRHRAWHRGLALSSAILGFMLLGVLATVSNSAAATTITKPDSCMFVITFHIELYGAGADSAVAAKIKNAIQNCWSGYASGCCPVGVVAEVKLGTGARTAGYDSIAVPAAGVLAASRTYTNGINNATDTKGSWQPDASDAVYAHEAGHLAGLGDTYKTKGKIEVIKGKEVDNRTTTPCTDHENDKMATLSGKIQRAAVDGLIKQSGQMCPVLCWADIIPAGREHETAVCSVTLPPFGTPSTTSWSTPSSPSNFYEFHESRAQGFDVTIVSNPMTTFSITLDPLPDPTLNPTWPPNKVGLSFSFLQGQVPPFLVDGQPTGPNQIMMTSEDPHFASVGVLDIVTGEFSGTLHGQLVNDLHPPSDPLVFNHPFHGQIFGGQTSSGLDPAALPTATMQLDLDLTPYAPASLQSTVGPNRPPLAAWLKDPSPNPFVSRTSIAYALSHPGHLTIDIFDVRGAMIRHLVDAPVTGGEDTREWDGRDDSNRPVHAGAYWVRVTGPDGTATRKIIKVE